MSDDDEEDITAATELLNLYDYLHTAAMKQDQQKREDPDTYNTFNEVFFDNFEDLSNFLA
jgi:hypothetical protein